MLKSPARISPASRGSAPRSARARTHALTVGAHVPTAGTQVPRTCFPTDPTLHFCLVGPRVVPVGPTRGGVAQHFHERAPRNVASFKEKRERRTHHDGHKDEGEGEEENAHRAEVSSPFPRSFLRQRSRNHCAKSMRQILRCSAADRLVAGSQPSIFAPGIGQARTCASRVGRRVDCDQRQARGVQAHLCLMGI